MVQSSWADSPHLSEASRAELASAYPPHERDARMRGIPQLGSGSIYPTPETEIVCEPFKLPSYWPRSYGMDVGWNRTAAIFGTLDRETDTLFLYSEYYRGQAEPSIHAAGIKAVAGGWMQGVIDPASRGRGQADGKQLFQNYQDLGLLLSPAKNGVEAGLFEVWQRLSTGRLKVFSTLQNFLAEYRMYRRDEKGNVVKSNDHLCDGRRYLVVSGLNVASLMPDYLARFGLARPDSLHVFDYNPLDRNIVRPVGTRGHDTGAGYDPFQR